LDYETLIAASPKKLADDHSETDLLTINYTMALLQGRKE